MGGDIAFQGHIGSNAKVQRIGDTAWGTLDAGAGELREGPYSNGEGEK
jgi:hypothetical protein